MKGKKHYCSATGCPIPIWVSSSETCCLSCPATGVAVGTAWSLIATYQNPTDSTDYTDSNSDVIRGNPGIRGVFVFPFLTVYAQLLMTLRIRLGFPVRATVFEFFRFNGGPGA